MLSGSGGRRAWGYIVGAVPIMVVFTGIGLVFAALFLRGVRRPHLVR